jgi:hypothetical protein
VKVRGLVPLQTTWLLPLLVGEKPIQPGVVGTPGRRTRSTYTLLSTLQTCVPLTRTLQALTQ